MGLAALAYCLAGYAVGTLHGHLGAHVRAGRARLLAAAGSALGLRGLRRWCPRWWAGPACGTRHLVTVVLVVGADQRACWRRWPIRLMRWALGDAVAQPDRAPLSAPA